MKISWDINYNDYIELVAKTVSIPDNNYRMEKALKLAAVACGDSSANPLMPLEILFLGGSITAGYDPTESTKKSYPSLVIDYLKNLLNANQIKSYNLGYSSFHSILELSVFERNKANYTPNIAILEYGVNNGFELEYVTSFEGIIQKLLYYYPSIAIIIISTKNKVGYSCEPYMKEIASHYNLPHISLASALDCFSNYGLSWDDYSMDLVHPHQDGHVFLSDCIGYILQTAFDSSNTFLASSTSSIQNTCFGDTFTTIRYYDASNMPDFSFGSFQPSQTHTMFPCGIVTDKKGNKPCILEVRCKKLYMIFEQSEQMDIQGQLYVKISPTNKEYFIESYSICSFGNPVSYKLIDGLTKDYSLTFQLNEDDIHKNFTILGFLVVN